LWAAPNSLLGVALGAVAVALGATPQIVGGNLEIGGGLLGHAVARLPQWCRFSAITFGHVILSTTREGLALFRTHECVHVRQYERWGIFFLPAYALSSLWQLLRGRNPYRSNYFERQAYSRELQ
jgi:hypothetical protein